MKKLYALFVVLALIAAACGDDDSSGDTSTAEPADDTAEEPADEPAQKSAAGGRHQAGIAKRYGLFPRPRIGRLDDAEKGAVLPQH